MELDLHADIINVHVLMDTLIAFEEERIADTPDVRVAIKVLNDIKSSSREEKFRGEWYPSILIRGGYFTQYTQRLAYDLGVGGDDAQWPYTCIDWDKAARELQSDYMAVDVDGEEYWY